jgi:hypothetical protein
MSAVGGGSSITPTLSTTNTGTLHFGTNVLEFSGSPGIGAAVGTSAGVTGTHPTLNITTTKDNSAILAIFADFNASGSPSSYDTINGLSATIQTAFAGTTDYSVGVAWWPDAGAAGVKTVGATQPQAGADTMIIAVEVLGTPDSAAVTAPDTYLPGATLLNPSSDDGGGDPALGYLYQPPVYRYFDPCAPRRIQAPAVAANVAVAANITNTFDANVTAGNALLAFVGVGGGSNPTITVSSTGGPTWVKVAQFLDAGNSGEIISIWYCLNAPAGPTTVTAAFSPSADFRTLIIAEYTNVAAVSALDVNTPGKTTAPTTTPTDDAMVTTAAQDLIVSCLVFRNATSPAWAGPGFVPIGIDQATGAGCDFGAEDSVQGLAGSISPSWNVTGGSVGSGILSAALKSACAPAAVTPTAPVSSFLRQRTGRTPADRGRYWAPRSVGQTNAPYASFLVGRARNLTNQAGQFWAPVPAGQRNVPVASFLRQRAGAVARARGRFWTPPIPVAAPPSTAVASFLRQRAQAITRARGRFWAPRSTGQVNAPVASFLRQRRGVVAAGRGRFWAPGSPTIQIARPVASFMRQRTGTVLTRRGRYWAPGPAPIAQISRAVASFARQRSGTVAQARGRWWMPRSQGQTNAPVASFLAGKRPSTPTRRGRYWTPIPTAAPVVAGPPPRFLVGRAPRPGLRSGRYWNAPPPPTVVVSRPPTFLSRGNRRPPPGRPGRFWSSIYPGAATTVSKPVPSYLRQRVGLIRRDRGRWWMSGNVLGQTFTPALITIKRSGREPTAELFGFEPSGGQDGNEPSTTLSGRRPISDLSGTEPGATLSGEEEGTP